MFNQDLQKTPNTMATKLTMVAVLLGLCILWKSMYGGKQRSRKKGEAAEASRTKWKKTKRQEALFRANVTEIIHGEVRCARIPSCSFAVAERWLYGRQRQDVLTSHDAAKRMYVPFHVHSRLPNASCTVDRAGRAHFISLSVRPNARTCPSPLLFRSSRGTHNETTNKMYLAY